MNRTLPAALLSMFVLASASAQTLSLDKSGGAIPGVTSWKLTGPAGAPYILLFALNEQSTPVGPITLDIPLDFITVSQALPGFTGVLNAMGMATPSFTLPNEPLLANLVFSCQAVAIDAGNPIVSNLVRVTPELAGTFAPALNDPTVPIVGGTVATGPGGELLFVGGSGPVAQRYLSRTEEWELAGATFGVGLLSQSTTLADGRVLFTGGLGLDGQPTNAAALYDPITQTTTNLTMATARAGHGASLMGNGRVLITGGFSIFNLTDILAFFQSITGSTEIFDPVTGVFTAGPTLLEPRALHTSTTVTGGQVLIAGGLTLLPIVNIPTVSATGLSIQSLEQQLRAPVLLQRRSFPSLRGRALERQGVARRRTYSRPHRLPHEPRSDPDRDRHSHRRPGLFSRHPRLWELRHRKRDGIRTRRRRRRRPA
jgi:hypothetical protein